MKMPSPSFYHILILFACVFLIAWFCSRLSKQEGRGIIQASIRMCVQILLIAFVLKYGIESDSSVITIGTMVMMICAAIWETLARQKGTPILDVLYAAALPLTILSLFLTIVATYFFLEVSPLKNITVAIPIFGMVLGNSLTCVAVSFRLIMSESKNMRELIEARLALGDDWHNAISDVRKKALINGLMIPLTNMMAASGVIILPGVMTGQILAGISPIVAAKYQIFIILLIAIGSGLTTIISSYLCCKCLFDDRNRLKISLYDQVN